MNSDRVYALLNTFIKEAILPVFFPLNFVMYITNNIFFIALGVLLTKIYLKLSRIF